MKRIPLYLALVASLAPGLLGAQAGHAVTFGTVSKLQYAECIEKNDRKCIRPQSSEMVAAYNTIIPDLNLRTPADLANYIRSLEVVACPIGNHRLARIVGGKLDLTSWHRDMKKGELCLYDNNRALFVASLSCGNMFTDEHISVATVMKPTPSLIVHDTVYREGAPTMETFMPGYNWKPVVEVVTDAVILGAAYCLISGNCVAKSKSTSNSCSTTGSAQACTSTAIMQSRGFSFPIRIP